MKVRLPTFHLMGIACKNTCRLALSIKCSAIKQNQCPQLKVLKPLGYYQNDGAQKISAANTNPTNNVEYNPVLTRSMIA